MIVGVEWAGKCQKNGDTLLDICVSSLRRGHANLLCIVPILTDDPRRESKRREKHKFCGAYSTFVLGTSNSLFPPDITDGVSRSAVRAASHVDGLPRPNG